MNEPPMTTAAVSSPPAHLATNRKRRLRLLALFNLGLLGSMGVYRWLNPQMPTVGGGLPDSATATAMKQQVYASIPPDDEQGFTRIDPANPGGWLAVVSEPLQPMSDYQRHAVVRPTATCRTIVIQPLGPFNA